MKIRWLRLKICIQPLEYNQIREQLNSSGYFFSVLGKLEIAERIAGYIRNWCAGRQPATPRSEILGWGRWGVFFRLISTLCTTSINFLGSKSHLVNKICFGQKLGGIFSMEGSEVSYQEYWDQNNRNGLKLSSIRFSVTNNKNLFLGRGFVS